MRPQPAPSAQTDEVTGLLQRILFSLGPLGAGILLDLLDLATFGPFGLCLGAVVGGAAGWILGKHEGFDQNLRIAFALSCAAYMTIPFTEPIPAATALFLLARFFVGPRLPTDTAAPSPYELGAN